MKKIYIIILLLHFGIQNVSSQATIFGYGAGWKYLDNGSNQGTAWQAANFADAGWSSGNGQLGYGDGDETTILSYGGNASNKYVTTYFRKSFTVSNPLLYSLFTANVKRDDGIIVYLNGAEIYRNNIASGTISYTTLASLASDDGATAQTFTISTGAFVSGNNVLAVEIHQNAITSSDISFDMELKATLLNNTTASLTRGPYLNKALQNGIVIRWRTDIATMSKVNYGTNLSGLNETTTDSTLTTEHIVTLSGLNIDTKYYYSIGSPTQTLQGDSNNYFKTLPVFGSSQKMRFLAMGDMGNNSANQVNVRNAWLTFNANKHTDGWILLGDNAYNAGTDTEYQTNFFNIYQGSLTKNHVLWPAPGNHDYANLSARQLDHNVPYYDMFSLPKNGEAGGIESATEAYYSYNYGNIHFIALDSYGWETGNARLYDTLGPQAVWLKRDLEGNNQLWTIVYFHHPPYTKGSHNSDTESELINMRQKIVPILERYKVDLVLNGHSHCYERSYLINGHYGLENTFDTTTHALSTSSAKYDGSTNSCMYVKNSTAVKNGIVYTLIGSAGQLGGTSAGYPHNAMYYSNTANGGALFFEVDSNQLTAKWIGADGVIRDNFNILKNANQTLSRTVIAGKNTLLSASWQGNYLWSNGATTRSVVVNPSVNTTYTVYDELGCLADVFNVVVKQCDCNPVAKKKHTKKNKPRQQQ